MNLILAIIGGFGFWAIILSAIFIPTMWAEDKGRIAKLIAGIITLAIFTLILLAGLTTQQY